MGIKRKAKTYLGDSVYVEFNGYELVLTTENGDLLAPSNTIYLGSDIWRNLVRVVSESELFMPKFKKEKKRE